jgi:hypothetical protein
VNYEPLKFVSASVLEKLWEEIKLNVDRYKSGSFVDLTKENGWAIETTLSEWDPAIVAQLDPSGTPEAEVKNSLLVFRGFKGMTPAMAREERLWVRLCHVECLDYSRGRWLKGEDDLVSAVSLHMFANGLRGCRDQNAIGRLWWNGHLASIASPGDIEQGLKLLLSRANIRLQIMDRADSAFRQPLVSGIFRLLAMEQWFDSYDAAIADFMYEVNKRSGGILFEAFGDAAIDSHLQKCLDFAKLRADA